MSPTEEEMTFMSLSPVESRLDELKSVESATEEERRSRYRSLKSSRESRRWSGRGMGSRKKESELGRKGEETLAYPTMFRSSDCFESAVDLENTSGRNESVSEDR